MSIVVVLTLLFLPSWTRTVEAQGCTPTPGKFICENQLPDLPEWRLKRCVNGCYLFTPQKAANATENARLALKVPELELELEDMTLQRDSALGDVKKLQPAFDEAVTKVEELEEENAGLRESDDYSFGDKLILAGGSAAAGAFITLLTVVAIIIGT